MLLDAPDTITLVVNFIWETLSTDHYVNPIFDTIFTSPETIAAYVGLADLKFHPDLHDILNSPNAPTLEWLKSFDTTLPPNKTSWGIYFLLLEKPGAQPLLYIGSRTSVAGGLRPRLQQHLNHSTIPHLMDKAYDNGYNTVHQGLLATCATPTAADVPKMRAVIIALETMFHWVFWSFAEEYLDYNLPPRATWDPSTLPWRGANSHNPMLGDVAGEFDLTSEELEEIAANKKANKVAQYNARYAAMTPEKKKAKNVMTEAQKLKKKAYHAARYQKLTPEERKAREAYGKVLRHARKDEGKAAKKGKVIEKTEGVKKTEVVRKAKVVKKMKGK